MRITISGVITAMGIAGFLPSSITAPAYALPGGTGSLLIFPNVELQWDAAGNPIQDTILTITNQRREAVFVQMYFVNGDAALQPVLDGNGTVTERAHAGWNNTGCRIRLDHSGIARWSALSGAPDACPFTALDFGAPPGRPDPEDPRGRVLRGFIYAWAVDQDGGEINWNFLQGDGLVVNYRDDIAWQYGALAFAALDQSPGDALPEPGVLRLDGAEYERPHGVITLGFSASGALDGYFGLPIAHLDTDLTLMPVSQDFRQDGQGPVTTKARFDIRNRAGVQLSGTRRCITCWDQTLLSRYDPPNHFLLENLQSDTGVARIDGVASGAVCGRESVNAALVGIAAKIVTFGGVAALGDWNDDGTLDLEDYNAYSACLDSSGPETPMPEGDCLAVFDIDRDRDVDLWDFSALRSGFGQSRSYSTVTLFGEGSEDAVIRFDVPR